MRSGSLEGLIKGRLGVLWFLFSQDLFGVSLRGLQGSSWVLLRGLEGFTEGLAGGPISWELNYGSFGNLICVYSSQHFIRALDLDDAGGEQYLVLPILVELS